MLQSVKDKVGLDEYQIRRYDACASASPSP
jgi:hypothetical protein